MRSRLTLLVLLVTASPAAAQQGSVRIGASAQVVRADDARLAGLEPFEPDLGLTIDQPAFRLGNLFIDLRAVRRQDAARLGRAAFGLRDVKRAGLTWNLTGGDTAAAPSLSAYAFTNLFAPQVSFAGGHLSGFSPRGSVALSAGRVTVLRNIFGSDPQTLGQNLAQAQARYRPAPRVELFARAARVRTRDAREFTYFMDASDEAGAGVRVRARPELELTADAGFSWFRRRGVDLVERSPTALVGAKWAAPRGWIEVNAQRLSPGHFSVVNSPFLDREGVFATGQLDVGQPLRLTAGFEAYRTNLDPDAAANATVSLPRGVSQRAFAGLRLHLGGRNFLTVRAEEGDRRARPVSRTGYGYDSDTGVIAAEFQTGVRRVSGFARYERRENVDAANATFGYAQHTASLQAFGQVASWLHLFVSAMGIEQQRADGGGQTFLQGGGGLQLQLPRRQLWLRGEALFSRSDDWLSGFVLPRELFTIGLSGQIGPRTALAVDVTLDRASQPLQPGDPWLARSMIRLVHTVTTGSARVAESGAAALDPHPRRGRARIGGIAFADWNANGLQDPGDEPLGGVPLQYWTGTAGGTTVPPARVTTGADGQFTFTNVPEGRATVQLDLAALPVDYDAPDPPARQTEARARGGSAVSFGLVPLGSVSGTVWQDANQDGRGGPGDTPMDAAIVVLDEGERSEQSHGGAFRFDAVRAGAHTVTLLVDSLPEGSVLSGPASADVTLERNRMSAEVAFLVKIEKRPEIRKTFPTKVLAKARDAVPAEVHETRVQTAVQGKGRTKVRPTETRVQERVRTTVEPGVRAAAVAPADGVWYAIQLAAVRDRAQAWGLVSALQARGIEAYLAEDGDGLAKVRLGSFRSRDEALEQLASLKQHQLDGWVARIGG